MKKNTFIVLAFVVTVGSVLASEEEPPRSLFGRIRTKMNRVIAKRFPVSSLKKFLREHNMVEVERLINQYPHFVADIIDKNGFTTLCWAAHYGHLDAVSYLLEHGAGGIDTNYTALWLALERGHKDVVECLLAHGADISGLGSRLTPLQYAVRENESALIEVLLRHGADTEVRDDQARTLLHYAITNCSLPVVKRLVDVSGALMDRVDHKGKVPLDYAVKELDRMHIFEFLFRHGAPFRKTLNEGQVTEVIKRFVGDVSRRSPISELNERRRDMLRVYYRQSCSEGQLPKDLILLILGFTFYDFPSIQELEPDDSDSLLH